MIEYDILFHYLDNASEKSNNGLVQVGQWLENMSGKQDDVYINELQDVFALWRYYEADIKEMEDYLNYRLNFLIKCHNRLSECHPKQQLKKKIAALKWVLQL